MKKKKDDRKFLNEFKKDSDVAADVIHLPDRIGNARLRSIPTCFPIKTYF